MRLAFLTAVVIALLATACAMVEPLETSDDREEFRQQLLYDVGKVTEFLRQTQSGANVSEFALGWYVNNFLIQIASHDDDLYMHFHQRGQFMETYLKNTFQKQPAAEIAAIALMAEQRPATLRRAAQYALEALRHIPNANAPPNEQALDRRDLADTLLALKLLQETALVEMVEQSAQ